MLRKYVTVRNVTNEPIAIKDRRLSHGSLTLGPGDEFGLPNDIYMDHRRRYLGKLVDISTLDCPADEACAQSESIPTDSQEENAGVVDGYPCSECDFVAKSEAGLASHIRNKHTESEDQTNEDA